MRSAIITSSWDTVTHGSGFAAHFLLDLPRLAAAGVVQAVAGRGQAQEVVPVQAAVAAGAAAVDGLKRGKEESLKKEADSSTFPRYEGFFFFMRD